MGHSKPSERNRTPDFLDLAENLHTCLFQKYDCVQTFSPPGPVEHTLESLTKWSKFSQKNIQKYVFYVKGGESNLALFGPLTSQDATVGICLFNFFFY